jgi:hexosaminidase
MNGIIHASLVKKLMWKFLVVFVFFVMSLPTYAVKPNTIPAIQQWTDGSVSYNFTSQGRIVLNVVNASQLAATAQVFQSDLLALTGTSLPIVSATSANLRPGDIFLTLGDSNPDIKTEGYTMSITGYIVVSAATDTGVFYGTRTILQLLKQNTTIAGGSAVDYPRYPWRGLHVDNGRLFVTVGWLENHIKEMAFLKMNLFHWHMSEWNNFRFQSDTHPEIVAAQHYTKAQVAEMMALAKKYHVTILPEFEMPGHMNWALSKHPELRAVNSSGAASSDNIDLTNPAAYTFISDILNEWLPLIPGPYFHIGTDEYITDFTAYPQFTTYAKLKFGPNANAKDVYLNFVNWANDIVRSNGKTAWAWDDSKTGGSVISINRNIILDSWTFAAQNEINQGFQLINSAQASLYYVWYTDWEPMQTQLYEQWAPNQWSYGSPGSLPPYAPGLLGAKMELWFDNNQCEEYSMAWGMHYPMRTIAQQTWASPKIFTRYTDFKNFSDQLGRAPGTTFPSTLPPIVKPNGPYAAQLGTSISFSSAGTTARNGTIAGYRWSFGDGGSSTLANPTYTYKSAGNFLAQLIVTDSNGMTAGNQAKVAITAGPPTSTVTVNPSSVTLPLGGTQAFTATVTGTSNQGVTWSATNGSITNAGFYTAPMLSGNYIVKATSVVNNAISGTATVSVATAPPSNTNLALNKLTTASTQFSPTYSPSKATDGDLSTRWCARDGTNGQWLMVDLGAAYSLTETQVTWESGGVWQYKIETSLDGTQWTVVVDKTTNDKNGPTYNNKFQKQARYVRITSTTNQSGHWASIYDFEVFGA